jgi:hypothetical protein
MRNFKNFNLYTALNFVGAHRKEYTNYEKFLPKTEDLMNEKGYYAEYGLKLGDKNNSGYIDIVYNTLEGWWRYVDNDSEEGEMYHEYSNYEMFMLYKNDIVIEKRIYHKKEIESVTKYDDEGKYISTEHPN